MIQTTEHYQNPLLAKQQELLALKKKIDSLPHLYRDKHYAWSRKFYESTAKRLFLTAANQIGKSTVNIKTCIEWAGNPAQWPKLYGTQMKPNQFWYMYPSGKVAEVEFETKWKLYLPGDAYKNHPTYGWRAHKVNGQISRIEFNTGVSVFFKFYTQRIENLQTATVHAVFVDEELPDSYYDEINMRLAATNGYYRMVFTATLGQDLWRQTMEPLPHEEERFPDAEKMSVSMFDCITFEDGSPSHWTQDRINAVIRSCKSQAEVLRRVYGKFVVSSGRAFYAFDADKHFIPDLPLEPSWNWASCIDYGSGGKAHPPAIVFVLYSPEHDYAYVTDTWLGDDGSTYTAGDIFNKYIELRGSRRPVYQIYDFSSKDIGTIAERHGECFTKADKSNTAGLSAINTLFRFDRMFIFHGGSHNGKLVSELMTLRSTDEDNRNKGGNYKKNDDLTDCLRYICNQIYWNWMRISDGKMQRSANKGNHLKKIRENELKEGRRGRVYAQDEEDGHGVEEEFDFWNELY